MSLRPLHQQRSLNRFGAGFWSHRARQALVGVCALAAFVPPSHAQSVRVETVTEAISGAHIVGVELGEKPELRLDGRTLALRDVLSIEYARPLLPTRAFEIFMADGSRLVGQIAGSDQEDSLSIDSEFGKLDISIEWMRRIRQLDPDSPVGALPESVGKSDTDHLFTAQGASLDGILLSMDEDGVAFEDEELGELKFAWSQLESVHVAALEEAPVLADGVRVVIEGRGGSRLTARLIALESQSVEVESPHLGTLKIGIAQLAAIRLDLGRVVYLSARDPIEVQEGNPWISPDIFESFYSWQRDRSVDRKGTPIQIGERVFRRGLGVHSESRLTYAIQPGDQVFQSWIGIDVTGRPSENKPDFGSVVFKVFVDSELRYQSGDVNWQKPAVRLPDIQLDHAKKLELVVEMGKGLHVLDRADWADARILKN